MPRDERLIGLALLIVTLLVAPWMVLGANWVVNLIFGPSPLPPIRDLYLMSLSCYLLIEAFFLIRTRASLLLYLLGFYHR